MYESITAAQANLIDPAVAPAMIDVTLLQCLQQSRPVYIELPVDMVPVMVDASPLQKPIQRLEPLSQPNAGGESALDAVLDTIYRSKQPAIFVDGESWALGILDTLNELIKKTNWPSWTSVFGKGYIDESLPNVQGVWKGADWAPKEHREYINGADLILCFGPHYSSTNSYAYSTIPDPAKTMTFTWSEVSIRGLQYRNVPIDALMKRLSQSLDQSRLPQTQIPSTTILRSQAVLPVDKPLTQDNFFIQFNKYLRPNDVIIAETGTAGHGCRDFELPPNTRLFKPATWLSIGYTLPATQGAALAHRDMSTGPAHEQRTILLIGDGSFQMTAQELSTIIREKLNVVIVLINNDGYTIERCLHGYNRRYNDVARWKYLQFPSAFGARGSSDGYCTETHHAENWGELYKAMDQIDGAKTSGLRMIEVVMGREDAPELLASYLKKQKPEPTGS
jgi:pyruvate decarboxylase